MTFLKCCYVTVVEISAIFDISSHIQRKFPYTMGHDRFWDLQLGPLEVFPRHITSPRVDLGSVHLQTSEGQIRQYFAVRVIHV